MVLLVGEVTVLLLEELELIGELLPGSVATGSLLLEITAGQTDGLHLGLDPTKLGGRGFVVHVMLLVDDILSIYFKVASCTQYPTLLFSSVP